MCNAATSLLATNVLKHNNKKMAILESMVTSIITSFSEIEKREK